MEIHHDGDLPARTGLGSSSSFTCGMYNAASALLGRMHKPSRLADEATHIERNLIGENVGDQDQIWAAYGGTNYIEFNPDGSNKVSPLVMSSERRRMNWKAIWLWFSPASPASPTPMQRIRLKTFPSARSQLHNLHQMADEAFNILISPDSEIAEFGLPDGRLLAE